MKVKISVKSYSELYASITWAEAEVLARVFDKCVEIVDNRSYADPPTMVIGSGGARFSMEWISDNTAITLRAAE